MIRRLIRAIWYRGEWCASEVRKALLRVRFGRTVRLMPGLWLDPAVHFEVFDGGSIEIGARSRIGHGALLSARGGQLKIGADSLINRGCVIVATCAITVGEGALIAEHVTIRDHDHAHDNPALPYWRQGRSERPIVIGSNVWLGAKATVTKGSNIPADSIIGANAVVCRPLPEPGKYVGAPARLAGAVARHSDINDKG